MEGWARVALLELHLLLPGQTAPAVAWLGIVPAAASGRVIPVSPALTCRHQWLCPALPSLPCQLRCRQARGAVPHELEQVESSLVVCSLMVMEEMVEGGYAPNLVQVRPTREE